MIGGSVAPGFEEVRRGVRRNFSERRELGAAVAAYVGGQKVVDLWGRPSWQRDTLVLVYSTSKGLSAMTLALLHSRGLLDYDERVSTYWPEFARAGKGSHCAAAPGTRGGAARDRRATRCRAAGRLRPARRRHRGPAAALDAVSITATTSAWAERGRAGPADRSAAPQPGRFFAEEIAAPLGLDVHFGVPDDVPRERIARIERVPLHKAAPQMRHLPGGWRPPWSTRARSATAPSPTRAYSGRPRPRRVPARRVPRRRRRGQRAQHRPRLLGVHRRRDEVGLSTETLAELEALPRRRRWPARPGAQGRHRLLGFARPLGRFQFSSSSRSFGHQARAASFASPTPTATCRSPT